MTFDRETVVLDVASDWTLTVTEGPWRDPFPEPLAPENREFVERCGRWTATAPLDEYGMHGVTLRAVEPVRNEMGEVAGVGLIGDRCTLRAVQWGGDLTVTVESDQ